MLLDGTTPLWIAATVFLNVRGKELIRQGEKVMETLDAEDIHDLRVASRRMREGMAFFAPCYPVESVKRLDKQVKKITRLLGEIRNTDEAIFFFTTLTDDLNDICRTDLDPFLASCAKGRTREVSRLKAGLRKIIAEELLYLYPKTIHALSLFTSPPPDIDLLSPLSGFAKEALDARFSAIRALLPQACDKDAIEAQHRLRIAVKHFRYRMELLSFLFGADYQQFHATVKNYQDVLGTMHDLDVFSEIARDAGFSPETEKPVLDAIRAKRDKLFRDFSTMLETMPLEKIAECARNGL